MRTKPSRNLSGQQGFSGICDTQIHTFGGPHISFFIMNVHEGALVGPRVLRGHAQTGC